MKVLNLYSSLTGNTEKVASRIAETVQELGIPIDTLKVTSEDVDVDILHYDFVFVGSGVYGQLAAKPMMALHKTLFLEKYLKNGEIKPAAPRRPSAKTVVYCTFGGSHTGRNEAVPAVKFMGQLFDHLGYTIVGEWYIVGEYRTEQMMGRSLDGRLGDIRGRPSEQDLCDVAERVKGVLKI